MKTAALLACAALLLGTAPDVAAQGRHCPPGLAKKSPPCVPPGLAKKGYGPGHDGYRHDDDDDDRAYRYGTDDLRYGDYFIGRDGRVYRVGDRIRRDAYRPLTTAELLRLSQVRDGYRYGLVDDRIVEIATTTNLVVRTLGAVSDLLN